MSATAPAPDMLVDAEQLSVSGVDIELIVKGEGAPLLYLHGLDGVEGSSALIDRLAAYFKVYAPSHPGYGASALPRHYSSVDDLGYFYLDLVSQLGLTDVVVAGFSFGGWVALETLVKDDSFASALVLGAPVGLPTADRQAQKVADIFMFDRDDAEAKMQSSPHLTTAEIAKLPAGEMLRPLRNAEATTLYAWSPYLSNPKLAQRLHRIETPTLILWGEDDQLTPASYAGEFSDLIPDSSFKTIAASGHRMYTDQPDATANRILEFTKQQSGRTAS